MSRAARLAERSEQLVEAAKGVKVLSGIAWPQSVAEAFLDSWRRGAPALPPVATAKKVPRKHVKALQRLMESADQADPIDRYLAQSAQSYHAASRLLDAAGTPAFMERSRELYGDTDGHLAGSELTHVALAEELLERTDDLNEAALEEGAHCIPADVVAKELRKRWKGFFDPPMRVITDENLSAKAAASATRVRLRARAPFSQQDVEQLSVHEIGVHSLTCRNGRAQPIVTALGLGAPRTTATQEGLATFAEVVTGAIDLFRLRRLALRIRALHVAEQGADFVEVFNALLAEDEPPEEAVRTTMRIFRGGVPAGGAVFTKDVVYLKGLFAVHTFMRKSFADDRLELVPRLFCGRLTLDDAIDLEEAFESKLITLPSRLPPWAENRPALAAFLAISALTNHVDLSKVSLDEIGRSLLDS